MDEKPLPISFAPLRDPMLRHATRLLRMVHELHMVGYQRLRISPGLSPSGLHWRCTITAADNIAPDGHSIANPLREEGCACYSSGQGDAYFNWRDPPGASAKQLAARFLDRFAPIAERGIGRDWAYAGWLTSILGRAEQGILPIFHADYGIDLSREQLPPPPLDIDPALC